MYSVIERLTMRLKLTKAALKSTSEEFRQAQENVETLEKEHKQMVRQIGELKKRGSELTSERDEARESAKEALERVSEVETKQHLRQSAATTK